MHITRIPSDIIEGILKDAAYMKQLNLKGWKNTLPLLAVCRNWRKLAIPIVSSFVIIFNQHNDSELAIDGNFQLIVNAGWSHHVRIIYFRYDGKISTSKFIEKWLAMLAASSNGWKKVQHIRLSIKHIPTTPNEIDGKSTDTIINDAVASIRQQLPNIARLDLFSYNIGFNVSFYSNLVDAYTMQLKRLHCDIPLKLTSSHFTYNLDYLSIQFANDATTSVPNICLKTLKHLKISWLSNTFMWSALVSESNYSNLIFESLKSLVMHYNTQSEIGVVPNIQHKLLFPKLRKLQLTHTPDNCILLTQGVFPKFIDEVTIKGTANAIGCLAKTNIAKVRMLSIELLQSNTESIPEFMSATNHLLSNVEITSQANLSMLNFSTYADIDIMNWPNLTCLENIGTLNASVILKIIPLLPNLQTLLADIVIVDVDYKLLDVPAAESNTKLEPIISKLKHLGYGTEDDLESVEAGYPFWQYLMIRLSSLETFRIDPTPVEQLDEFFMKYSQVYPHLASMQFLGTPS